MVMTFVTPDLGAAASGRTTNDDIRRRNLSAVLTLLHTEGALARSQLGAITGLNRSTITGLIADLLEFGLVVETGTGTMTGRAGRPTVQLEANRAVVALSIRVEARTVTVALVGLGGVVHARIRHDASAPPSPRRFVRIVAGLVDTMRADIERHYTLIGAGLIIPGLVGSSGSVLVSPALGWRKEPIAAMLSDELRMPVAAGNDASVGAMAEARFGVGRGVMDMLYLGGGPDGLGGGIVMDGAVVRGTSGYAGELGHTMIDPRGTRCVCGRRGCLEAEVSQRRLLEILGKKGLDEDELDVELGVARDPQVLAEVARQVDMLSMALTNFVNAFSPELVVLSGYPGVLLSVSRERLTEAVKLHPFGAEGRTVRLERSRLRSRLMVIGPAELAFAPLLDSPVAVRSVS